VRDGTDVRHWSSRSSTSKARRAGPGDHPDRRGRAHSQGRTRRLIVRRVRGAGSRVQVGYVRADTRGFTCPRASVQKWLVFRNTVALHAREWTTVLTRRCLVMKGSPVRVRASAPLSKPLLHRRHSARRRHGKRHGE